MTRDDFEAVIWENPELCADGFGVGGDRDNSEWDKLREELFGKFADFAYACQWLKLCKPVKKANRFATSMELKHKAARFFGGVNIRHGAFLAAAIYLGVKYERVRRQPCCVYLAVAKKLPEAKAIV